MRKSKSNSKDHVFVIAEAGSNWRVGHPDRDLQMAKALIDVAVDAGADAVKFQTYRAKSVYVQNAGHADYLSKAQGKRSISDIFDDLSMPYEMIPVLAQYCKTKSIEFMSTPFSVEDFKALNPFVQRHKVASYEIAHLRLLDAIAKTGKPVIMSSGAATFEEVQWSMNYLKKRTKAPITLLQCTAKYPASFEALNLNVIRTYIEHFQCTVGLSDHSRDPLIAPIIAIGLGARVIEKHFTLHNMLPGPDHPFALVPTELKQMIKCIRDAEKTFGMHEKAPIKDEIELRSFAVRAIQAISNIQKGDKLIEGQNFDVLRPGKQPKGMHPRFLNEIQGKHATKKIKKGHGIKKGDFI